MVAFAQKSRAIFVANNCFIPFTCNFCFYGLIKYAYTCILIFGQHFAWRFVHHLFVGFVPRPIALLRNSHPHSSIGSSNGNGRKHRLTGLHFGEINQQLTAFYIGINHFFECSIVPHFCPNVQIVDKRLSIHRNIENAQAFHVGFGTSACAMPWLYKI